MEYKELARLYCMDASSERNENAQREYERRYGSASSFHTGFVTPNGELFIALPRELSLLNEQVLRSERIVARLLDSLPGIAGKAVLRGLVLDEVVCSNAIEDIHSTRRQVRDAIEAAQTEPGEKRRFKELALLYLNIIDGTDEFPRSPAEVRAIYDRVTAGEIDERSLPDGKLFRKEGTDLVGSGGKILHRGINPEEKIIQAVEQMISLTRNKDVPGLYGAVASHYLFEYAHPFYDGNGRTGRYLLSLLLSKVLSVPTALSLSRAMVENRNEYYRAFRSVENPLNRGELTFFVYTILDLVQEAQTRVIERLEKSVGVYHSLAAAMDSIAAKERLKAQEQQIVFLLLQYEAFGLLDDVFLSEISACLQVKKQMARKHIVSLEKKDICEKRRKYSPVSFALTQTFKSEYGIETLL